MVLSKGTHPILCDGCWIIGGTATIGAVYPGARIVREQDKATFSAVGGGTFSAVWGGTFSAVYGGTKILLRERYESYVKLDDSAKAHLVASISAAVKA